MAFANNTTNAAFRAARIVGLGTWAANRARLAGRTAVNLTRRAASRAVYRLGGPVMGPDIVGDIAKARGVRRGLSDVMSVLDNPELARAYSPGQIDALRGRAADMAAEMLTSAATPVVRYFSAAPQYGGYWGLTKRVSALGVGSFILGSSYRLATGNGNPLYDRYGRFDLAGIPLV